MSREQIPITPEVLSWARERSGYTVEELSSDFPHIEKWERGEALPSYPQLERLSEAFKVPIAVFFFSEPPDVPPLRESFRTLPDTQFEALPRSIRYLLRKAKALQINLSELNDGRNPVDHFILRDLKFATNMNTSTMAQRVREYLSVPLEVQISWTDSEQAFDAWRMTFEAHGVAVFKDAFRNEDYSGFCLYDEFFPLIYVNNSVKTRQVFTLFHELAHLLFHTSGIDAMNDEPDRDLPEQERQIEIECNRFASEFLLPATRFELEIRRLPPNEETAEQIASRYHISREFVFRRFLDRGAISRETYMRARAKWAGQRIRSSGGNHYWTKISYLGTNYIGLAYSRYYQSRISELELADYLDTKVKHLSKLEDYFSRKVV